MKGARAKKNNLLGERNKNEISLSQFKILYIGFQKFIDSYVLKLRKEPQIETVVEDHQLGWFERLHILVKVQGVYENSIRVIWVLIEV